MRVIPVGLLARASVAQTLQFLAIMLLLSVLIEVAFFFCCICRVRKGCEKYVLMIVNSRKEYVRVLLAMRPASELFRAVSSKLWQVKNVSTVNFCR